jgi:Undecaprenyl-phosphate glucose phosphotransferase
MSYGRTLYGAGQMPLRQPKLRHDTVLIVEDLLPGFDVVSLLVAGYVSTSLYVALLSPVTGLVDLWNDYAHRAMAAAVLAPFILYYRRTPSAVGPRRQWHQLRAFVMRYAIFVGVVLGIGYLTRSLDTMPRAVMVLWVSLGFALTLSCRAALAGYLHRLERKGILSETVAVVGAGPVADRLIRYLLQLKPQSIRIVGVFDDGAEREKVPCTFAPTGSIGDLVELGKKRPIDWVLITLPPNEEGRLLPLIHTLKSLAITVGLCPQNVGLRVPCHTVDYVADGLPVTLLADRPIKLWSAVVKSAEDFLLGGLITLLLLPLMGMIALAIKLDSPGPVLFKQRRHTSNNIEFEVFKFRTMRWCPEDTGDVLRQTCRDDERVTHFGHFLRRSSLDELPQLFNVLRGEMSLVGPRPHAVNMRTEQRLGHEIIDTYPHRHRVKPGITGWSQVNGSRGATETVEQLRRRVELDLHYVEHWSLLFDLKILLMTIWVVLRGTNAR